MGFFGEWLRRAGYLLNRRRLERDLQREMEAHREMMGEPKRFGNTLRLREESRDAWGWNWLDTAWQDVKFAGRTLRQSPGFALGATIVLGLGIGLNLTLFQIYDDFVLRPLPIRDIRTLVELVGMTNRGERPVPYPGTQFIRSNNNVLAAVLTCDQFQTVQWADVEYPSAANFVSSNWFDELGYPAALGRVFRDGIDDRPDAAPVVVVSHRFWTKRLNSDPGVVGSTVRINDRPVTLVGVAPENFPVLQGREAQMWMPIEHPEYFFPGPTFKTAWTGGAYINLYARLKPGVSLSAARAVLRPAMDELALQHPEAVSKGEWLEPYSATDRFEKPRDRQQYWTNAIGFGFLSLLVLTVASANLGNLVLSRAVGRLRELSVRIALGASRWRVMRHLLAESALLAAMGSLVGLGVSYGVLKEMAASLDVSLNAAPDWRTMLALLSVAAFAMVGVGFLPTWAVSRRDLGAAMKDGGQNASSGLGQNRLRSLLSGVQVAGSCVLLLLATLTARNLQRVLTPGLDFEKVAIFAPQGLLAGRVDARSYWSAMRPAIASLPETEDVALTVGTPFMSGLASGFPDAPDLSIAVSEVEPQFFKLMRLPIVVGRPFDESDDPNDTVIISRRLAMRVYGTLNVLGRTFPRIPRPGDKATRTIVGVAEDAHVVQADIPDGAEYYLPLAPERLKGAWLLVRARTDPGLLLAAMRETSREIDYRLLVQTRLLSSDYANSLHNAYVTTGLAAGLASLTLFLACLGIFGVMSYGASLRRKEISIRMVLGADRSSLVRLLMKQSAWPALLGMVGGFALSLAASEILKSQHIVLGRLDASVLISVAVVLSLTCGIAALIPALQAVSADITQTLRND